MKQYLCVIILASICANCLADVEIYTQQWYNVNCSGTPFATNSAPWYPPGACAPPAVAGYPFICQNIDDGINGRCGVNCTSCAGACILQGETNGQCTLLSDGTSIMFTFTGIGGFNNAGERNSVVGLNFVFIVAIYSIFAHFRRFMASLFDERR